MTPKIKLCGLTRPGDARFASDCGIDFAGVIFAETSPRRVTAAQAEAVFGALSERVKKVLVTQGFPAMEVRRLAELLRPDVVQLHGGAAADFSPPFPGLAVWRAVHLRDESDVERAAMLHADAIVADASSGGSGRRSDWRLAELLARRGVSVVLAGGLDAGCAAAAAKVPGIFALDFNSGAESAPGIKDNMKLLQIYKELEK